MLNRIVMTLMESIVPSSLVWQHCIGQKIKTGSKGGAVV
jgi:hypothetical protein